MPGPFTSGHPSCVTPFHKCVHWGHLFAYLHHTSKSQTHFLLQYVQVTYRLEPLLHSNCSNTQKDEGKKEYIVRSKGKTEQRKEV